MPIVGGVFGGRVTGDAGEGNVALDQALQPQRQSNAMRKSAVPTAAVALSTKWLSVFSDDRRRASHGTAFISTNHLTAAPTSARLPIRSVSL
jgi:hypothetical protein